MTSTTIDAPQTESATTSKTTANDTARPGLGRRLLDDLMGRNKTAKPVTRGRVRARTAAVRLTTLFIDWLLIYTTVSVIIPTLGTWLFIESNAGMPNISSSGQLAVWLVPLLFLVGMVFIGEVVIMRALWRLGAQWIATWRSALEGTDRTSAIGTKTSTPSTTQTKRRNKKRRN